MIKDGQSLTRLRSDQVSSDRLELALASRDRVPENDAEAWVAEAARLRRRVAAYIRRTIQDPREVDDLLAETWAGAWCEHASTPAFLPDEAGMIIHARVACTRWKAARRHEVDLPVFGVASALRADAEDVEPQIEDEYYRTLQWMRELPQQQHYALVFRLLRGSKFEMVAAAMGCSVSAAKTHYWRGIKALKLRRARST